MTWQALPQWARTTEADGDALLLTDESGQPRGRVRIDLPDDPESDGGLLDKMSSSIDRLGRSRLHAHWVRAHTIPRGQSGTVQLPYGGTAAIRSGDGSNGDWLRRRYDCLIRLPDREHQLRHRSRRRSDLMREGVVIARLRRTGGPWIRFHDATGDLRTVFSPTGPALDDGDLLALMLAATVLGPAGNRGLVGNFLSDLG